MRLRSRTPVAETEPYNVYIGNMLLSDDDERPEERVDGERATFTFESTGGIVTVDGVPQTEGKDYAQNGVAVTFTEAPARNAQLRQYPGAFLSDSETGEVLLARVPRRVPPFGQTLIRSIHNRGAGQM